MRVEQLHRETVRASALVIADRGDRRAVIAAAIRAGHRVRLRTGAMRSGPVVVTEYSDRAVALQMIVDFRLHRHLADAFDRHPGTASLILATARVIEPTGPTKGQG